MALINRVSRLVKADFHAVLDNIEEPELLLKQAIRDMEDELAETEQRIILCSHDQEALAARIRELNSATEEITTQLDLCFNSGKDDLAKSLLRKRLEAERILKRLVAKRDANHKYIEDQRNELEDNGATLESLRQKAELLAHRPVGEHNASQFDDIASLARDLHVCEEEVEIAFLREKEARAAS